MTNPAERQRTGVSAKKADNALIHHHTPGIHRSFNQANKHGKLVKDNSPASLIWKTPSAGWRKKENNPH